MHYTLKTLLFLSVLLISSCDSSGVYDKYKSISNAGWEKNSKQCFDVNIKDTIQEYNFILNIRNNNEYPYRNVFFFVNTHFPDSTVSRDTIEVVLADKKGQWLGEGFGEIKTSKFMLQHSIRFPQKGDYTFEVMQGMRCDTLKGIEDIGIRIEKFD